MFYNHVVKSIKLSEITEYRTRVRRGELHSSPGIIRVITSRRMKSAGYVACMGERCMQGFGADT